MHLDHIGIAVENLARARAFYEGSFGARFAGEFDLPEEGIRIAWLDSGSAALELMAPTGEGAISRFMGKRGPGLHHLGYRVDRIGEVLEGMRAAGYELIDGTPRPGLGGRIIAFLHPRSAGGVLVELCEGKLQLGK
ncbi:MAG: methylmalonyl-CoA epimerase [bacterium]